MGRIAILSVIFLLPIIAISPAFAQEEQATGILPDSFLWGIDVALDRISYQLANNPSDRSQIGLEIAHERLLETKAMLDQNRADHAQKSQVEHDIIVGSIETDVAQIDNNNQDTEQKFRDISELRSRIAIHKLNVEQLKERYQNALANQQEIINKLETRVAVLEQRAVDKKIQVESNANGVIVKQRLMEIERESEIKTIIDYEFDHETRVDTDTSFAVNEPYFVDGVDCSNAMNRGHPPCYVSDFPVDTNPIEIRPVNGIEVICNSEGECKTIPICLGCERPICTEPDCGIGDGGNELPVRNQLICENSNGAWIYSERFNAGSCFWHDPPNVNSQREACAKMDGRFDTPSTIGNSIVDSAPRPSHSFCTAILDMPLPQCGGFFEPPCSDPIIRTSSFEECAKYYPVMESFPRQCRDGAGNHFVEEIDRPIVCEGYPNCIDNSDRIEKCKRLDGKWDYLRNMCILELPDREQQCREMGGKYNECGSSCGPNLPAGTACIALCQEQCTFPDRPPTDFPVTPIDKCPDGMIYYSPVCINPELIPRCIPSVTGGSGDTTFATADCGGGYQPFPNGQTFETPNGNTCYAENNQFTCELSPVDQFLQLLDWTN